MEILAQTTSSDVHGAVKFSSVLLGIVALYIGFKVVKVVFKFFFILIGIALLGMAAWWYLLRH